MLFGQIVVKLPAIKAHGCTANGIAGKHYNESLFSIQKNGAYASDRLVNVEHCLDFEIVDKADIICYPIVE